MLDAWLMSGQARLGASTSSALRLYLEQELLELFGYNKGNGYGLTNTLVQEKLGVISQDGWFLYRSREGKPSRYLSLCHDCKEDNKPRVFPVIIGTGPSSSINLLWYCWRRSNLVGCDYVDVYSF